MTLNVEQDTINGAPAPPVSNVDLTVRVPPRAEHDAIVGERDGVLRVGVAAGPVEGPGECDTL